MNKLAVFLAIFLTGVHFGYADEAPSAGDLENIQRDSSWEGVAHFSGDRLSITLLNNSIECAYVRLGQLSDQGTLVDGLDSPPLLSLEFLYPISDYRIEILWPVKKGTKGVTGNEMLQIETRSKAICDMIKEEKIQTIEITLSLIDLPLKDGVVTSRNQKVRCSVKIMNEKK